MDLLLNQAHTKYLIRGPHLMKVERLTGITMTLIIILFLQVEVILEHGTSMMPLKTILLFAPMGTQRFIGYRIMLDITFLVKI